MFSSIFAEKLCPATSFNLLITQFQKHYHFAKEKKNIDISHTGPLLSSSCFQSPQRREKSGLSFFGLLVLFLLFFLIFFSCFVIVLAALQISPLWCHKEPSRSQMLVSIYVSDPMIIVRKQKNTQDKVHFLIWISRTFFFPNEQPAEQTGPPFWQNDSKASKMLKNLLLYRKILAADWKKFLFQLFVPQAVATAQPLRQPSTGKRHLFMSGEPQWKCEVGATQRDILFFFPFLFSFFGALTLTPQGAELQRALINGSGDAPALRHSPRNNEPSRGAEQGKGILTDWMEAHPK